MPNKFTIEVDAKHIYDQLQKLQTTTDSVLDHAKKTNGRVTVCEGEIGKLKTIHIKQAGFMAGVIAIVTVVANYLF